MLTVIWDPQFGEAVPDDKAFGRAIEVLTEFRTKGRAEVTVGTLVYLTYFQLFLHRGQLRFEDVQFLYLGTKIPHQKNGRFSSSLTGFADQYARQLDEMESTPPGMYRVLSREEVPKNSAPPGIHSRPDVSVPKGHVLTTCACHQAGCTGYILQQVTFQISIPKLIDN